MAKRKHSSKPGEPAPVEPKPEAPPVAPAAAKPLPPAAPRRGVQTIAAFIVAVIVTSLFIPRFICQQRAAGFYEGDAATEYALADAVAKRVTAGVRPEMLHTGSEHFNGEWALVTNQMAVLGMGQIILAHPEAKERYLPAIRAAVGVMLEVGSRKFGTSEWGEDGLSPAALDGPHGHAYLGYLDMALSMQRLVDPEMSPEVAGLNDRLTAALTRKIDQSEFGLIETFPGVTFPADVATVIGAIGLHARATKKALPEAVRRWSLNVKGYQKDGLMAQTASPHSGEATSAVRGSGNAFSAYLIAFADPELAKSIAQALIKKGHRMFWGFGGIAEYPLTDNAGPGDMDSGPVINGIGISATGFGIGAERLFGNREKFVELYRTAYLFGAPGSHDGDWSFLVGEGLGDAILLAMLTADPNVVCFPKEHD